MKKLKIYLIALIFIFVSMFAFANNYRNGYTRVSFKTKFVDSLTNLNAINYKTKLVNPIVFHTPTANNMNNLTIQNKIKAYINIMLPSILIAKQIIQNKRNFVLYCQQYQNDGGKLTKSQKRDLLNIFTYYGIKMYHYNLLLQRLYTPDTAFILAQSALESGWGTSNFFRYGNNAFGIKAFVPGSYKMEASGARGVYDMAFKSVLNCINYYLYMLATSPNYAQFQLQVTHKNENYYKMLTSLKGYSQTAIYEYRRRVLAIINNFDLTKYNSYKLNITTKKTNLF